MVSKAICLLGFYFLPFC